MEMRFLQLSALLVLAACGTSAQTNSQGSVARGRNSSGTEGAANLRATPPPFKQTTIATFDNPWAMAFIPGTRQAIVTEKPGRLYLVDIVTGQKISVSGAPKVVFKRQGGLLDVVLAPGFASNRLIYLTYSEPSANGGSGLALARAKLVDDQNGARIEGLERLWHDPGGGEGGQFGAILVFAPDGKSLFLSSGERQRFTPAQDPSQAIGKILHLTLDGKPAPGNPWAGRSGSQVITLTDPPEDTQVAHHATGRQVRLQGLNLTPSETWSLGHRNPYGLAFAADGRLWETEMGPRGGDELNLILPGRNYGWPIVSQGENYDGVPIPKHPTRPDLEPPKLYWVPSVSPTSLIFYSGPMFKQWDGDGIIGSLSGEVLIHVRIHGSNASAIEQWGMGDRIRFVAEGPDGAIYLLQDGSNARLVRLTPG